MPTVWMVRSGSGGAFAEDFVQHGRIAIGFDMGDLSHATSKDDVRKIVEESHADSKPGTRLTAC